MAEVYVTLGEAAELERVKYNTMVKRVLRKQEPFVTKTEKSEKHHKCFDLKGCISTKGKGKQDNNHKRDIHIREMGQRRRHHHPSD